ncbi:CopZ family metallochaperone [Salinisphaera sp.]|uniref:CopZ family metallochaperone n=1 Tax=Salinisphaera sp. TaxID=1914330 RepID=UPI002D77A60C|nr:cation transporter [Salinisphaera sp.]HET7313549.1 cation transporter [Salinisphaera sp.]
MTRLKIEGISCRHCVAAVDEALAEVDGVERVLEVDLDSGIAKIEGDVETEALLAAVREEGYEATAA